MTCGAYVSCDRTTKLLSREGGWHDCISTPYQHRINTITIPYQQCINNVSTGVSTTYGSALRAPGRCRATALRIERARGRRIPPCRCELAPRVEPWRFSRFEIGQRQVKRQDQRHQRAALDLRRCLRGTAHLLRRRRVRQRLQSMPPAWCLLQIDPRSLWQGALWARKLQPRAASCFARRRSACRRRARRCVRHR